MEDFAWKENDIVKYDIGLLKGKGKIKGVANSGVTLLGKSYILEDLSGNIPNDTYPYTHFVCFEIHLQPE